jgi:hypothetical protein
VIHRYRRPWLLVGVLAGLLAAPAGASAAVLPDAVLTVHYIDAVTLLPVDGALVQVTARQADQVIGEYDAATGADGSAILTGLPIDDGQGAAVVLDLVVDKASTVVDEESACTFIDSWHAERLGIEVDAPALEVAFAPEEQSASSLVDCDGGDGGEGAAPTGAVGGVVGTPKATLPATDTLSGVAPAGVSLGLIVAGAILAITTGLLFAVPRPRRGEVRVRIRTPR